ncbi:E3 SUMO-protein ligase ZBED1-like isoform X2 [Ornithodoros turicata]|uniref:E3 SUMO-protein ligase ZBED1-like isoform X2 n=1 Tax=Ornithodoros turicata TaxID=34597 RepID=UPI003138E8AE
MPCCCVPQCSNNTKKGWRLFRVPRETERRNKWCAQIKRDQWQPTRSSYVCSAHFEESAYEQHRADNWKKLRPDAVPTLFRQRAPNGCTKAKEELVESRISSPLENTEYITDNYPGSTMASNYSICIKEEPDATNSSSEESHGSPGELLTEGSSETTTAATEPVHIKEEPDSASFSQAPESTEEFMAVCCPESEDSTRISAQGSLLGKRSAIWTLFTPSTDAKARCNLCHVVISYKNGTTGNLRRHVRGKHVGVDIDSTYMFHKGAIASVDFDEPQSLPPQNEQLVQLQLPDAAPGAADDPVGASGSTIANPLASHDHPTTSTSAQPCRTGQSQITSYMGRPLTLAKVIRQNKQLLRMVAKDYHPLSFLEDKEFKQFVSMLNPSYQLPSRKTLSTVYMPQMYAKISQQVRSELQGCSSVCLTTETWTSPSSNESYVGVTAHFIDENHVLTSRLLDCFVWQDPHRADNISAELSRIVAKWGLEDKICAVVSDDAEDIKASVGSLGWRHIPCFAHVLNLAVQAGMRELSDVRSKVKAIVTSFKHSSQGTAKLQAIQQQMGLDPVKLKQDVATRWHSTYEMFSRMVYLKDAVPSAVAVLKADLQPLTPLEWTVLENACKILKPFKEVTEEMGSEKHVTLSKVILLSNALMQHVECTENEDLPEACRLMAGAMMSQLKRRYVDVEDNDILAESTVLDPRFKQYGFTKHASYDAAYRSLCQHVTKVHVPQCPDSEQQEPAPEEPTPGSSLWETFELRVSHLRNQSPTAAGMVELERYLKEPLLPRTQDPLSWWRDRKQLYPRVHETMKSRMCIPATSVPCERMFSKAGQVATEARNRLSGKNVRTLMFLNANM